MIKAKEETAHLVPMCHPTSLHVSSVLAARSQLFATGSGLQSCEDVCMAGKCTQYVSVCIQVKELYQGVLGKLQLLHPRLITEERMGESYERMRREVEREVVRRKTLASQLRTLLGSQLEVDIKFLMVFFHYHITRMRKILHAVCF